MSKTYRFAILGTGWIARKMAEALDYVQGAEKYAIASRDFNKSKKFADEFGFKKAYESYEEAANDKEVDVVYIATPHNMHCVNALMCMEAGKHVLCEKPFAVNRQEVELMIAKAKQKGVFLMEAMWSRFHPHIIKAKELIENGELGEIQLLTADFGIQRPVVDSDRKFNRELIGGALLDIGIYPVFAAQYFLGKNTQLSAQAVIGHTGVDFSNSVMLKYEKPHLAVLHSSFMYESGVKATIYGDKATLLFDSFWFMPGNLKLQYVDGREEILTFPKVSNGYQYEAQEVVNCLNEGLTQSESMSWNESLQLIDTLDAIRKECGINYPGHDSWVQ